MNRDTCGTALGLLLLALATAGCGSQSNEKNAPAGMADAGTTETAAVDPCALVSKEDVAAATGGKILAAKAEGDNCTYEGEDAQASSVTVTVKRDGAAEEMNNIRAAAKFLGGMGKEMAKGEGAQGDVGNMLAGGGTPGTLGDESLFDINQQLHLRKGDIYLAVAPPIMRSRMSGGNPLLSREQKRAMATAIAQKALDKL